MSVLKIYKASAGSGKTFRLTREYIKLLIGSPYTNYKRILAVTFTNKAAAEMKSRILRCLQDLSMGDAETLRGYSEEMKISPLEIQKNASIALKKLLHDYSKFSVGTIDAFFQKIIRSFTKEMGLPMNFIIEMDNEKILDESIDLLLNDLGNNELLTSWMVKFSEKKIEDGKTWDFKKDILALGSEIFKEEYALFDKELTDKLSDKNFLENYSKNLFSIKNTFETHLKNIGDKALEIIKAHSLEINDFSYKQAGVAGYLKKMSEKNIMESGPRVMDALNNSEKWYPAGSPKKEVIKAAVSNGLNDLLSEAMIYYNSEKKLYNTVLAVVNFIYTLGILTDISKVMREHTDEKNIFLLSDSSILLKEIIHDNDAPFIYEKTGSIYKYFMIDEFQDTSVLQWSNFKPLILNSLSEGNNSLLVGDVKQSIYRWRNSDWNILAEQVNHDFPQQQIVTESLQYNWRSKKNIIRFNNTCFHRSATILQNIINTDIETTGDQETLASLQNKITNAYQDYFQIVPEISKNSSGVVNISFTEDNETTWKDKVKEQLPILLESLQDRHYSLKDIAILVRDKKDGREIANTLIAYKNSGQASKKYGYDVISNDSLFIESSSSVQLLLAIMRFFTTPGDLINQAFILHEYYTYVKQEAFDWEITTHPQKDEAWFYKYLPVEFVNNIQLLKRLPLMELLEHLVPYFSLDKNTKDLPFLQAFQEVVLEYSRHQAVDLASFLEWWSVVGYKKTISAPDGQDAIRILTIHKSKGLEFKAVIIPFCNWEFEETRLSNIIWCNPDVYPLDQLNILPVKYSKKLSDTLFYQEYFKEKLQSFVDNLNLLYVAFTRAEDELHVFAKQPKQGAELKDASGLLFSVICTPSLPGITDDLNLINYWDEAKSTFRIGEMQPLDKTERIISQGAFELSPHPSCTFKNRLKLSLHCEDFFLHETYEKPMIDKGKLMHELFSKINTLDDIDFAFRELAMQGKISENESPALKKEIEGLLGKEPVKNWFSDKWKVKNEAEILLEEGKIMRPDRVLIKGKQAIVIDYKFGEVEKNTYTLQVKEYMKYLELMGFTDITGFIWYIHLNKIVNID